MNEMKKLKKNNGITLIALVITIIVLLILAGVSISMLTGDNGILMKAQRAKDVTQISSEKEALQLTMINKKLSEDEKYNIWEELIDRTLANGDNWKIISINETKQIYGTGWYYIPKGTSLENYGETKREWLINYSTGEVMELTKDGYTKLAYGENLAVTDGIILNADQINMSDEKSWGEGVTVYGIQEGDGYGWNEIEFKLDGVDDYIEVYPQENVNIEKGLTFEFYASSEDDYIPMLCKTIKGETDSNVYMNKFRTVWTGSDFSCSMSKFDSGSDWLVNQNNKHWIIKRNIGRMNSKKGGYLTMIADIESNKVSLYWNGEFVESTSCNHEWMVDGYLTDASVPFTIGFHTGGITYTEYYGKVDIYACRLYNKVLTADEVKDNYNATVTYHDILVNEIGE